MLETSRPELIEIVGSCLDGAQPRGLVLCDPQDAFGWALVAVVADQRRPAPEIRFFPSGGLERVAAQSEGFVLQGTTRERAEAQHADLFALIRKLPEASAVLDDGPQHVSDADLVLEAPQRVSQADLVLDVPRRVSESDIVLEADDAALEPDEGTSPFALPLEENDGGVHELLPRGWFRRMLDAASELLPSAILRPAPRAPMPLQRRPSMQQPRRVVAGPVSVELVALPPGPECTEPDVAPYVSEV
jgi:hypothetical protein